MEKQFEDKSEPQPNSLDEGHPLDEYQFMKPKDQLGYAEEYIVVKYKDLKDNLLLNYSLSNNLDDIKIAIYSRTGHEINLENAHWKINRNLSINVKHLMNKHRVKYSMTTLQTCGYKQVIVNMRADDIWFITGFDEFQGSFYCWNEIEILQAISKLDKFTDKK
jgi:hypothetical protein